MRKVKYVFLSLLIAGSIFSQPDNAGVEISRMQFQAQQVIGASPEAAELGKYGNVPVSLFTGTPSISIPLVELKGTVLSLPVSLSYSASGFKPEDIAPWTGLGWILNGGGVITRSVRGDPDMDNTYTLEPVPTDEYDKSVYYEAVRNKYKETQPDIYYYNFMGKAGKFLVDPAGGIMDKEKKYMSINISLSGSGEKIFLIVDEQGIQYEFSELEKTTIQPIDDQPNAPPLVTRTFTSAWYLKRITSPYGNEELEFEYHAPTGAQSTVDGSLNNMSVTYTLTDDGSPYWPTNPVTSVIRYFHPPVTTIVKKFLKKITLKKNGSQIGYIDIESDENMREDLGSADFNGERMLKKVKLYSIKSGVNTLIKEFSMGYEYFGANQSESPGYYRRLKLKTVQEISPDPNTIPSKPPYTFYYYNEYDNMPGRFTSGLDHWGFYNGKPNMFGGTMPCLIPNVLVGVQYVGGWRGMGADREPDAGSATITVLEKITYPTGGYTTFEYGGHTAVYNNGNRAVGGIRIVKMTDHSFPNKPAVVKTYDYTNDGWTSSGYTTLIPGYYELSTHENGNMCSPPLYNIRYEVTISANSLFALGTVQGSHIGYTRVTESQTDLSTGQSLGKTVYYYEIQGSNEISEHLGNGDLKKKQVYDNGGKLLEETINTYLYENTGVNITGHKIFASPEQSDRTNLCKNASGQYLYWHPSPCVSPPSGYLPYAIVPTLYNYVDNGVQQQRSKLTEQTIKVFDNSLNGYLVSTKKFTYGNSDHTYPTLIEETNSKQEKVFTSIKYVADYSIACSPQTGSMAYKISAMKAANMMGIPVEKLQYKENASGGNRRYVSGSFTEFTLGLPEKIYFLQSQPMPTSVTSSEASCNATQLIDANYRLTATMTYDANMNLKEESKTNDVPVTYFWGYSGLYPVAKVLGKDYNQALTSGITQSVLDNPSDDNTMRTELNKLRSLSSSFVSSYTYNPMVGTTSETDARGRTKTFEYDILNRLVNIKDEGEIVKSFKYNYGLGAAPTVSAQSLFYNASTQATYTKMGCPIGTFGDEIVYVVPYGKHASSLNQTDANNKAAADKQANGQAYANAVGLCRWWNAYTGDYYFKDNCPPEAGPGEAVWYSVPAGMFKSLVSQLDADAQATTYKNINGPVWANYAGSCSCEAEGHRYINGVCETGQLYHGSATQLPDGSWECAYYYVFSDAYVTPYYYYYSSSPCPIDP